MPSPDADLVAACQRRGSVDAGARWQRLEGGNTNDIWQVGDRIVKRFRADAATPIFGNDPVAETRALTALAGTGLAPTLIDAAGDTVVYRHVAGHGWTPADGVAPVARALRRLHGIAPPAGLPTVDLSPAALVVQTRGMGGDVPPLPDVLPPARAVFLHGDATAANALVTGAGVTFIDWQCPAIGDPVSDIAVFLSPAMQVMSGNPALTADQCAAFLAAYDDADVTARYRALAPLYAARMRAYCTWRAARGDAGYAAAALAE